MKRIKIRKKVFAKLCIVYIILSFILYLNTSSGLMTTLLFFSVGVYYLVCVRLLIKLYNSSKSKYGEHFYLNYILMVTIISIQLITYAFNIRDKDFSFGFVDIGIYNNCLPHHYLDEILGSACGRYVDPSLFWIPMISYVFLFTLFILGTTLNKKDTQ